MSSASCDDSTDPSTRHAERNDEGSKAKSGDGRSAGAGLQARQPGSLDENKIDPFRQLEMSELVLMAQYRELKMAYEALSVTERKYRNLYEHSPEMLRSISEEGTVLDCNENYARNLGYTKDEVIGSSVFEHTAKKSYAELTRGLESWKRTGSITNQTVWMHRKDGSEFPVLLSGTSLYDEVGTVIGRTVSLRDMTEIYTAKEALEEEKARRLMEIGELSARLTHDIRNPLDMIYNAAQLLRARVPDRDPKESALIDSIFKSARRISNQINDVLNYVRSSDLQKSSCSVLQVIGSCIEKMSVPQNITISLPDHDLYVDCDSVKLEVIFENMIKNSIQAIDSARGTVAIAFRIEPGYDYIEISDSGPGIPPEILPQVFKPLFTTKRAGTGLGLPTCKNLAEQHGWTLQAKLPSTFVIKIPVRS